MATQPRRNLLNALMGLGFLTAIAGFFTPVVAYLLPLKGSTRQGNILEDKHGNPIPSDTLQEGVGRVGRLGSRPVLAIRKNGQILGFGAVCPHLGCMVRWNNQTGIIECPCHGARFNLQGHVVAGPPPRALRPVRLTVEGDRITAR